jgi:hypothetical protein
MTNWHRGAARADVPGNNENGRESDARLSKCRRGQAISLRKGLTLSCMPRRCRRGPFRPCAQSPRKGCTKTARRDGWAFPFHYISIGPLQVIIGSANIRQGCRSRRPKEKMADPAARTSKCDLELPNYLKTLSIIMIYATFPATPAAHWTTICKSSDFILTAVRFRPNRPLPAPAEDDQFCSTPAINRSHPERLRRVESGHSSGVSSSPKLRVSRWTR